MPKKKKEHAKKTVCVAADSAGCLTSLSSVLYSTATVIKNIAFHFQLKWSVLLLRQDNELHGRRCKHPFDS